ncbi:disease resistance protein PIK6-NP-like [Triticum dicoccoides]|uniref:disease resistance protein PIK6-NP-like n=1 Tax=Triticum dicoccoides TaxID=85692 RepID=UPI00188F58DC|nr:disease resistance protein PIK6-NP-like [Triticum dicoccoides]
MADRLAVGLAKSVVVGAVTKIQSAIDEDARLRQKVKRDLVFISMEFEMMQSLLDDANEEMNNNLVRTWVKHIKELAYDVEDCVENVVHLDDKPIFWRRLLPSWLAPPLPLDLAVEEIEHLKGRVEDVNNCYRRYNQINDSASKLVMQQQLAPAIAVSRIAFQMLEEARGATKKQRAFGGLTRLIIRKNHGNNGLQVISVWGAACDDGMTSIVRKAYNNQEIRHDFPFRSWVKIVHPFSPHQFIRNMMTQFHATSCMEQRTTIGTDIFEKMEATQKDLFTEFEQLFKEKRYLIVLEGLSHMVDWDAIRAFLPDTKNGSVIIVSTQQSEIATLCVGQLYQIVELGKFSDEHSVCALFKDSDGDEDRGKKPMASMEDKIREKKIMSLKQEANDWKEKNDDLVGRESQMTELVKCLSQARVNSLPVMSVWGMPGVGKSALVKKLFYDTVLQGGRYEGYYWVDVTHPFNMRDLYRILLSDFHSEKDPIEVCHRLLKDLCLIIIDDLRSTEDWDMIQAALVSKYLNSVVIVITTDQTIAEYCTNTEELVLNVKALEANAAFDLFTEGVLKTSSYPFKDQEPKVRDLISKCGGLPKVISPIAGLLARKTNNRMEILCSLNRRFMHHLETDLKYDNLQELFSWMHSMVLNPPAFLKPCIFYLSIFPQGHIIRRRRLIRRWIAEGNSREIMEMQAEKYGEIFFSELLRMSIFEQVSQLVVTSLLTNTRMVFYKANGLIQEYILSRQKEENLVFELGSSFSLTTQSRGRHLVISTSWVRDNIVYTSIDFSRLRSLTVFGEWETFFISESMNLLRVLDLEDASGVKDADLVKIVKLLRRLKFLSLRGCNDVYHLPSSLGDLRQLQTLDVRGTSIVTLPASITKLQKLQYIRAGCSTIVSASTSLPIVPPFSCLQHFCCHRRAGVQMPILIGKLTALHTLGVINVVASGGKSMVNELKKLTHLRKLGVSGINRKNSGKFFSAIGGHVYLESLSVCLDKDNNNQGCLRDMISLPCRNLLSLKLYGLEDKLPEWEDEQPMKFGKLTKLELEMASLPEDVIRFLGRLPELCILRVKQNQDGDLNFCVMVNGFENDSFKKVKILEISCSSSLPLSVNFGSWTMKILELLKVECYGGSPPYEFSGLGNLEELKEVVLVNGSSAQALKQQLDDQLVKDHPKEKKPVVKLEQPPPSS